MKNNFYATMKNKGTPGETKLGSCLTDATRRGRARLTVRVFAAMLRSERLRNNHRGLLTRWNHTNLRASTIARKFWTDESDCQASTRPMVILLRRCYRVDVAFLPKCVLLPNHRGFQRGRRDGDGATDALALPPPLPDRNSQGPEAGFGLSQSVSRESDAR
jgi:hypothetical protein